jgi:hypothetical protein
MSGGVPTLDRCVASNIGYFSFTCSGNITSLNGLNLIEKGIVYSSTVGSPTINDVNCVRVRDTSIGLGISITPTGLIDNTTYYMNTYAINEYGLSYGRTQITIGVPSYSTTYATTLDYVPVIPWYMVTEPFTDTLWSIKSTEITVPVRYVLGNDGRTISTFGAVYSTSDTTPNSGWSTSSGSVAFMGRTDYKGAIITGLSNATTYYVYSYGIDNLGTYRFGDKRVVTTLSILNQLSVVATLTPSNTANSVDLDLVSLTADNVPVSYGYQYGTDNTLSTYTEITSTIPWGVQYNHHTYMTQGGLSAGGTYYFRSWELYTSGEKRLSAIVSKTTGTGTGNYMSKTTTTYWDSYVKGQGDSYIACTKDSTNIDTLGLVNTSTGIFGKLPTSLFNKSITVTPKCRFFGRLYFNDLVVKNYDRQSYGVYNHEIIFKFFDYAGYKYIDGTTGKYTIPLKSQQSLPHNIIYWIGAGKDYVEIMDKNLTTGDWEINHVGTPFTSSFGTSSIITNTFTINSPSFDSATINFQRQDSMIWGGITTPTGSEQTSVSSFKQLSLQKHPYLDALYNFTIDA